ncbi:hypothetical protein [Streptomyces sp. LS1784]|uniref:hypothetical protein n=1 Tax=Streptomyces sp. LS1784 TaxID=2851533 RepID=UPI001CCE057F|nr:hypothetical protein [Streptomyces sp. LS1784]
MTSTAHTDLTHIAANWPALRELLEARTPSTWPPVMGLQHIDQDEDQLAAANQAAAVERAERTAVAPGERPAPLRVSILDTITELDAELVALADEIASSVQRPAFTTRFASAAPNDDVARSLALMGLKDQQDSRRWRFNMAHRDGARAATWLAARVEGQDGPFRPLSDNQRARIATVAAAIRRRLDQALGDTQDVTRTHLHVKCGCGSALEMLTGSGEPHIICRHCGTHASMFALLDGLDAA